MSKTTSWLLGIFIVLAIAFGVVYASKQSAAPVADAPMVQAPIVETPAVSEPDTTKSTVMGEWGWDKTVFTTGMTNPTTGTNKTVTPAAGKFVATFGTDLSLSSTTDCNALKGKYIVDGEVLSIGSIVSTKMACASGSLESEYTKELGRVGSYTIKGNELSLHLLRDTGTMIFTRRVKAIEPAPVTGNVNINGTTFRLVSFNNVMTPADSKYTLSFTDKNLSAKFCNGLGGEYTISNGVIDAGMLVGTMMYCESPAGLMAMESTFSSILSTGASFLQSGSTLTITGSKGDKFVYTVFMD